MKRDDVEKPALVEEIGPFEGLRISKGPELLPPPEALDEETNDQK